MESSPAHTTRQAPSSPRGVAGKATASALNPATPIRLLTGRRITCAEKTCWQVLDEIAAAQRNRAARAQLLAAGFTPRMLNTAVRRGVLHRDHRGVYVIGACVDIPLGRETSALLIAPRLVLVSMSVLLARGVIPPDRTRPIDVSSIGGRCDPRPGIRVHRYRDLRATDIRITEGLPMTTVERALLDAADELTGDPLQEVVDEALAARLTSRTKLRETADAAVGRRGRAELLALADARRPSAITKRAAAALALTLIRQAGLTEPQTEVMLFGFPADFYFAEARLVLEVDSFGWHGLVRSNFNRDRRRDRVHRQHGLEVVRVTYDELRAKPLVFIGDLSGAIARRLAARAAGSLA